MIPNAQQFKRKSAEVLADKPIQANLRGLYSGFHQARLAAGQATPDWEEMRDSGRDIKTHTIRHLDHYLEQMADNVEQSGGRVFFAHDAESANRYIVDLAQSIGARTVIKSKSMVSEETGLGVQLEAAGIEAVETDLGEYIIQLADESPFHIIAPAIHKSRQEVADLFHDRFGSPRDQDREELMAEARKRLRDAFARAEMSVTGGNFMVADTGTLALVTNEGNGRMCTSMPRVHVAMVGMEKIIPSMADLGMFLKLLIRSATGQRPLSSYVTLVSGPRSEEEEDGPEEFHLVVVDNGRSKLLADPELREALNCLKCGACLNACPVYRKVGGHSYGWVYGGPIGAVLTPAMTGLAEARDLPYASSLCGACREACPVRIDIPRMLLHLRKQIAEGDADTGRSKAPLLERLAFRLWSATVRAPSAMRLASVLGRFLQLPLRRRGTLRWLPPPLGGWTKHRHFPALASKSFRDRWKNGLADSKKDCE